MPRSARSASSAPSCENTGEPLMGLCPPSLAAESPEIRAGMAASLERERQEAHAALGLVDHVGLGSPSSTLRASFTSGPPRASRSAR